MEVSIVTTEFIKPSSKTPDHLKYYQFSPYDRIVNHVFLPFIFYYETKSTAPSFQQRLNILKASLSKTLTLFYPLAGRIKSNDLLLCSDEGVPFVVANVNSTLSTILQHPNPTELDKLSHLKCDSATDLVAALQISLFSCGGVSVGFNMSHKIGDAYSMFMFLNSWASVSRGETNLATPLFNSLILDPPTTISGYESDTTVLKKNIVTKRFLVDSPSILALQNKYSSNEKRCSRAVALTTFIYIMFMKTFEPDVKANDDIIYFLSQAVNLRTKIDSPDAKHLFGNIFGGALIAVNTDSKDEDYGIVSSMTDAIRSVSLECRFPIRNAQHLNMMKNSSICQLGFSSMSTFPVYEVNFGWGNPIWFSFASWFYENGVMMYDTKDGCGIEAWITLDKENMEKFENHHDLLAYLSPSNTEISSRFQIFKPKL